MIQKYPCLIVAVHAHGHDDGCRPILDHLADKYVFAVRNGKRLIPRLAGKIADDWRNRTPETLVIEAPYPTTSSALVAKLGIAPQKVTHVLGLVDVRVLRDDPYGHTFETFATVNGVSAVGLGNLWLYDPASEGAVAFGDLGDATLRLIAFIEQYLSKPVVYVATSPTTIVDRELTLAHEAVDTSSTVTIGVSDAP